MKPLPLLSAALLASAALPAALNAAEEIRPPFGFQWGESSARLEQMLIQAKAQIAGKETVDGRLRIEARGISQRLLQSAFFYFEGDGLVEIELHYGDPAWDIGQMSNFFDQTRRHIDNRYGAGRLIARTKSSQNELDHSLIGYQWTQPGASLQLFLFSAEKGAETVRILSLHYRSF